MEVALEVTALHLFDLDELPPPILTGTVTLRAYCVYCEEFLVTPETGKCLCCGRPLDRRYEYVEMGEDND